MEHDRLHQSGQAHVDRELSPTQDLPGTVDEQPPLVPDQPKLGRVLQAHVVRNGQLLRPRCELAEACLLAARVRQHAAVDRDLPGRDLPRIRRCREQAGPRLGTGRPVAQEGSFDRIRSPSPLVHPAGGGIAVDIAVRPDSIRRVDHANRIEVRVEFLRYQRGEPGVNSLTHLDLGGEHDDRPVLTHAHIRVHRIGHLLGRQPVHLRLRGRRERARIVPGGQDRRRVVDRCSDPRIGPAAAEIAAHPLTDRGVVGRRVRAQQRHRGQRLAGLAVAALHDVAAVPRVADRIDHPA